MNVVEIADSIFRTLQEPLDLSIPKISYWIRYIGVGKLNNLLDLELTLDSSLNFSQELDYAESSIMSELYIINYYDKLVINSLGANSYDTNDWISIKEIDGTQISRVNYVEKAKVYKQLKNDHEKNLTDLVNNYRLNKSIPKEDRCEGCY